jgi:hypothetical protein
MNTKVKELLEKQLQLLSERSAKLEIDRDLVEMSHAMARIADVLSMEQVKTGLPATQTQITGYTDQEMRDRVKDAYGRLTDNIRVTLKGFPNMLFDLLELADVFNKMLNSESQSS